MLPVLVTGLVVWHAVWLPGVLPRRRSVAEAIGRRPRRAPRAAPAGQRGPAGRGRRQRSDRRSGVVTAGHGAGVASVVPPTSSVVTTTPGVTGSLAARALVTVPPETVGPTQVIDDPSTVATAIVSSVPLYSSPDDSAPFRSMASPNYLGAPLVLLVAATQDGWVKAYVPIRPNGSMAWIPAADVVLSSVQEHILVDLAARRLTLYSGNEAVFQVPVAPGAPRSPTPTGMFFVTYIVRLTDPGGPYGPYALGLSGFSDTYFSFEGGPGQIAIHGTDDPSVIGSDSSNGCIRLRNADVAALAKMVPWGIPVEIYG